MRSRRRLPLLAAVPLFVVAGVAHGATQLGPTQRLTVLGANSGVVGVSDDSRYLLAGVSVDGVPHALLLDRTTGATEQVDLPAAGVTPTGATNLGYGDVMSADARYVAFNSNDAFVPEDTNSLSDVFVRDRSLGTTVRASLTSGGSETPEGEHRGSDSPAISADGQYVVFASGSHALAPTDTDNCTSVFNPGHGQPLQSFPAPCVDVFLRDLVHGTTEKISAPLAGIGVEANGHSSSPKVSGDGRYVAFRSTATDLVAGDTNGAVDVFVRDRITGMTERVSVASDEAQGDASSSCTSNGMTMSRDGRYIAFESLATNLAGTDPGTGCDIFVRDRVAGTTERITAEESGSEATPNISADGRFVLYGYGQAYLYDRLTTERTIVSATPTGDPANGFSYANAISFDGGISVFASRATDLGDGLGDGQTDYTFLREIVSDSQAPTITITTPTEGAAYSLGQSVASAYGCQDEVGGSGLSTCLGPVVNGALVDTSTAGQHTFQVSASDLADNSAVQTHTYAVRAGNATQQASGGTTVTTDPGGVGASAQVPIQTALTLPASSPLTNVSIGTLPAGASPTGFQLFDQEVSISTGGLTASATQPYTVGFTIDKTRIDGPPAILPADIQVFRDGVLVVACAGGSAANPDPCVASRDLGPGGDAVIVVRTTHFSVFSFGRLVYAFAGFFQPVDNLPTLNAASAGSAIPVKFGLGGNRGLGIFAAGYPKSEVIGCSSTAPVDGIEETVNPGSSTLTYDAVSNRYSYVWKTDKNWSNSCRQLVVRFADGTVQRANFKFK